MSSKLTWNNVHTFSTFSYKCGHCGTSLSSEKGYFATEPGYSGVRAQILICHKCTRPTFVDDDKSQHPGSLFGDSVKDIEDQSVQDIYTEARKAYGASAYTAAVLCCRKLLMHIAVSKGAPEGKNFVSYVNYLGEHHFVPPGALDWVDHIREKGNEANHEICISSKDDAEELISFSEMLLKVIFEFPASVKKRIKQKKSNKAE